MWRVIILTSIFALVLLMYKISTSDDDGDDDKPLSGRCLSFAATHATRHMRRRRRHILYDLIQEMPKQPDQLNNQTYRRATLWEARCLLHRSRDPELKRVVQVAAKAWQIQEFENEPTPDGRRLSGWLQDKTRALDGRRALGRWNAALASAKKVVEASPGAEANPTSATRRITRGLGVFAGNDFPCAERDAFIGASWAANACLIKCEPGSRSLAPRCSHAIAVCEKLAQCATVDINVEASVATLKLETALSSRTSRVKNIALTQSRGDRAVGRDGPCPSEVTRRDGITTLKALAGRAPNCILDCPKLNSTRAVEVCYRVPSCVGVDISFQIEGHGAVARLRFEATN